MDQPTNQPVSQLVSHPASYRCEKRHAPWTWRIMSISAICAPQPANRPARLLYLQSCCAVPLKSIFLSLVSFPFNLSRSCCTVLSNPVQTEHFLSFHVSLRFIQVCLFHALLLSMLALLTASLKALYFAN